ncbi:NusG domain II-containing protein [Treponema zioleckii]|uniref:NusG domain II-containing protein n=1 Tax=Treponema zioleckii TaxID=331680 RepID=UPI00168B73EB|nr:NusG domain II-containing protein [Treponema zioleckii]
MKLAFKPLDFFIVFAIIFTVACLLKKESLKAGDKILVTANGRDYEFSTLQDATYRVQGALGETVFSIRDKNVFIISSPCPNKICMTQHFPGAIVCLPNKVFIRQKKHESFTGEEFDAISR